MGKAPNKNSGHFFSKNNFVKNRRLSRPQLIFFAIVFAAIGAYVLIRSFAYYDPTALVLYHPDGTLVKSTGDPSIYLIEGEQRHFVSLGAFESGQYSVNDVQQATTGDEQLSIGDPVTLPSGDLVKDRSSGDYFLTDKDSSGNVVRRPISSSAMAALGYNPAQAQAVVDLPPVEGSTVSSASAHASGTKVTVGSGRTQGSYMILNGQLRPATADVLSTYKFSAQAPVAANRADLALPKGPALPYADGTLVQGSDPSKIYVIDTNSDGTVTKRLIRDTESFMAFGYDTKNIHKIADNQLPTADGLPLPENDGVAVPVSVNIKPGQDGTALAKDYKGHPNTTITSSYKDWVAMTMPVKDIVSLSSDPRVAFVSGAAQGSLSGLIGCDGPNGTQVPCPVINSFTAGASSVQQGGSTTLNWSSTYASYCTASGGWSGQKGTSGSQSTGALSATTSYGLVCTDSNGNDSGQAGLSVAVTAPPNSPSPPPPSGNNGSGNYSSVCNSFNVTFYENTFYGGKCLSVLTGAGINLPDLTQVAKDGGGNWNDTISSIYFKASGITVSVYSDANYGGTCATYTSSDDDFTDKTAGPTVGNDAVSSIKVGTACPSSSTPTPPPPSSGGCSGSTLANNTPPAIAGTPAVGVTLNSTSGTWCGSVTTYRYEWQHCVDNGPDDRNCTNISGAANSPNYTVQKTDAGYQLDVLVVVTNSSSSASASSPWTSKVPGQVSTPPPTTPPPSGTLTNTGLPVISGNTIVGSSLRSTNGSWSVTPTTIRYQWLRCDPNLDEQPSRACTNISAATGVTYTLQSADANQAIAVNITATYGSSTVVATSQMTAIIQPATGGGGTSGSGGCDGTNGVYLYSGANYTGNCQKFTASSAAPANWVVGNDAAQSIKVVGAWTATLYQNVNYGGDYSQFSQSHSDMASYDVGDKATSSVKIATGAPAATNTSCPSNTSTPGVYLYGAKNYSASAGCDFFTAPSLTAENWHIGDNKALSVRIVGNWAVSLFQENALGVSASAVGPFNPLASTPDLSLSSTGVGSGANRVSSIYVGAVNAKVPVNSKPPVVSGSIGVGSVLTTTNGTWTNSPTSYLYQWEDCFQTNAALNQTCNTISGATSNSYTLRASDVGLFVRVFVTAKNASGTGSYFSDTVGPIIAGTPPPTAGSPIVTFTASPTSVAVNGTSKLTWSTVNATTCKGSGGPSSATSGWVKAWPTSGSYTTPALTATTTFTLSCSNASNAQTTANVQITVGGSGTTPTPPSGLAAANPGLAAIGWTAPDKPIGGTVAVVGVGANPTVGGYPGAVNVVYSAINPTNNQSEKPNCNGTGDNTDQGGGHDSMVARFIGLSGDGLKSPAGVAPGATILPIATGLNNNNVACGIRWAADHNIKIINLSLEFIISQWPSPQPDFNNPSSSTAEPMLAAIHYAVSKGAVVFASAGNTGGGISDVVPARYTDAYTIAAANEFNGLSPNNPQDAKTPPKDSNSYIINSAINFCGIGSDDAGASYSAFNDVGKANFWAEPLCVWMGETVQGPDSSHPNGVTYQEGTSFAAPMAAGIFLRTNSLSNLGAGGTVLSLDPTTGNNTGHNYGNESHL